jgi:hypothetical protein
MVLVASAGLSACGSTSKQKDTSVKESAGFHSDKDFDNEGRSDYYDVDDYVILNYARPAGTQDIRAASALFDRYYRVAVVGNGAAGCALSYSLFAEAVSENSRDSSGERGVPCSTAMTELFKRQHARMAAELASLRVTGMRIEGDRAYLLLGVGGKTQRYWLIHREAGIWKAEEIAATELG